MGWNNDREEKNFVSKTAAEIAAPQFFYQEGTAIRAFFCQINLDWEVPIKFHLVKFMNLIQRSFFGRVTHKTIKWHIPISAAHILMDNFIIKGPKCDSEVGLIL